MADTLNQAASRVILGTRMRGGPQPAPSALGLVLRNALDTHAALSETNFLVGYVHATATPALPGADGRFYHEVQRVDSGTCALHALNAYSGSAKYTLAHLAHAQTTLLGLSAADATHAALNEGNEAAFVNAALTAVEGAANHAVMDKPRLELAALLDKQDASIDRVMVGLAGPGEPSGHWVAFRRDAARKWHRIDSFPSHIVEGDPQPIQSPADFLRQRAGTGSTYSIIYR